MVIDAVLLEGGGFDDFLTVRGALLPDDEQALARRWLRARRSVFEVEEVRSDGTVAVRDVRTGECHQVNGQSAGRQLWPGQLVCARVMPDGAGLHFIALQLISAEQCGPLITLLDTDPDPVELMAQLSSGAGAACVPAL